MASDDALANQYGVYANRGAVRMLRLARGWSLEELARRADVSWVTVQRVETGHPTRERRVKEETLIALAEALGVDRQLLEPPKRGRGRR